MIITSIVSTVTNRLHTLSTSGSADDSETKDSIKEGKEIVAKLSALKHEMGKNAVLS